MSDDLRSKLKVFAERMVTVASRCTNEESTKLFLILPFLSFLGYDTQNPDEVCPEHNADFSEKFKNRVDFAIMRAGSPIIAIECKTVGAALRDDRGQLRAYFNAALTIKMGVLTDGIVYEFYADSDEPNMMDQTAFLTLDMRELAKGKFENSVEEGIKSLQKGTFDPESIGVEARRKLIFRDFLQQIGCLAEAPTETFVKLLLQNAGVKNVRAKSLIEYTDLAKSAFKTFVDLKILQRLDLPNKDAEPDKPATLSDPSPPQAVEKVDDGLIVSPLELAVFNYVKRRLAFLVTDDKLFEAIESVDFKNYKGKFVVFFKRVHAGRLFDFYDEGDAKYNFDFDELGGDISTDKLADIDKVLLAAFVQRVAEAESSSKRLAAAEQ